MASHVAPAGLGPRAAILTVWQVLASHHTALSLCCRLLPYLREKGLGVINASVLSMGLLTHQVGRLLMRHAPHVVLAGGCILRGSAEHDDGVLRTCWAAQGDGTGFLAAALLSATRTRPDWQHICPPLAPSAGPARVAPCSRAAQAGSGGSGGGSSGTGRVPAQAGHHGGCEGSGHCHPPGRLLHTAAGERGAAGLVWYLR